MNTPFIPPSGFELKTGEPFSCGLIDVDYIGKSVTLTGIAGHAEVELNPHDVWVALKEGPAKGTERSAVVVFHEDDGALQLAHYDLEQFQRTCYGPL